MRKLVLLATAVLLTLTACDPISSTPAPAPDHGPNVEMKCATPFIGIETFVLAPKPTVDEPYAPRQIGLSVKAVDADGRPVEFIDTKTGTSQPFRWSKAITTSAYRAHTTCVEYGQTSGSVPFLLVTAGLQAKVGDSLQIQVWTSSNPDDNACLEGGIGSNMGMAQRLRSSDPERIVADCTVALT